MSYRRSVSSTLRRVRQLGSGLAHVEPVVRRRESTIRPPARRGRLRGRQSNLSERVVFASGKPVLHTLRPKRGSKGRRFASGILSGAFSFLGESCVVRLRFSILRSTLESSSLRLAENSISFPVTI